MKQAAPEHTANREIVIEAAHIRDGETKHAAPEHKAGREIVLQAARMQTDGEDKSNEK